MTLTADQATNRRRFLKFIAASPLFAGTSLAAFAQEGTFPERPPDPFVWAPRDYAHLIASPSEALDVFDFEPVMHKNVFRRSGRIKLAISPAGCTGCH